MKTLLTHAVLALSLVSAAAPASAQGYGYGGGYDGGYGRQDYGYRQDGRERRDYGYDRPRFRDYDGDGYGRGRVMAFDADEYLRCNPDVRRAVRRGQMESAEAHYRVFGRREGRRLSC